jgi:hypothetical protein
MTLFSTSPIMTYSIAGELLNYAKKKYETDEKHLSLTRLEQEIFGGVTTDQSLRFWREAQQITIDEPYLQGEQYTDYLALLYSLFIAMTNEEIYAIRDSYFKDEAERVELNRSAM